MVKALVFDLDGTLYRGTAVIPEALDFVSKAQKEGIEVYFLTNNAMRTPAQNKKHMEDMGYNNISQNQFYNSAMAAADYVALNYPQRKAWFIGQLGLKDALEQDGFEITEDHPDFVFVGMDQSATYKTYCKALDFLLNGAKLIGTNSDRLLATPAGFDVGNGAVVAMLEYASGQQSPQIGKPHAPILDLFLKKHGLKREDVVVVGDNLETDIALGYNNQVKSVFVMSGVHGLGDIDRLKIRPDLVLEDLGAMEPRALLEMLGK